MSVVERKRRYRKRQRQGIQVVPVEVDQEIVESLIAKRLLNPADCGDSDKVSVALEKLARDASL